jgi:hypothetical protein
VWLGGGRTVFIGLLVLEAPGVVDASIKPVSFYWRLVRWLLHGGGASTASDVFGPVGL